MIHALTHIDRNTYCSVLCGCDCLIYLDYVWISENKTAIHPQDISVSC